MEIPRHWRLKDFRYRLIGWKYKCGAVEIQKRPIHLESKENGVTLYNALGTVFSPNHQVVHRVVVRQNQEQDHES